MKISNPPGLTAEILENGTIRCIDAPPIRISMKPASPFSKAGAGIWLRKRTDPFRFHPLTGPSGNNQFSVRENDFTTHGSWEDIEFTCTFRLSEQDLGWQWIIELVNHGGEPAELDLVCLQDAGLKTISDGLVNEYYVSQYTERRILHHDQYGTVACCRQNMKDSGGHPWLIMACANGAASGCTDGMQFYGNSCRETGIPAGLLNGGFGDEYAGESSLLALQEKPFIVAPGASHHSIFFARFMPDHPEATSDKDLLILRHILSESGVTGILNPADLRPCSGNQLSASAFLHSEELTSDELEFFFGKDRRNSEFHNGQLLSFFCNERDHVVLKEKEVLVDRPHGHIMQAFSGVAPDERIMSTTAYASGIFNSHISQGNTNFGVFLSVNTSQFNLERDAGQRIIVRIGNDQFLLGVPSAFEMGLNHCRWIYKYRDHLIQVRTWTSSKEPCIHLDFKVLHGDDLPITITHAFDPLNGWSLTPVTAPGEFRWKPLTGSMIAGKYKEPRFRMVVNTENVQYRHGSDALLFPGDKAHGTNLFVLEVEKTSMFCITFCGEVLSPCETEKIKDSEDRFLADRLNALDFWQELSMGLSLDPGKGDTDAFREILPWFGMNALTHFLTPYGLEQFSGAAWGTRDISQGPIDLLLTLGKYDAARKVLTIIFTNQNPDGGWPQWWMFDRFSSIRAGDSHGDIYYWCIIALSQYIRVTGDLAILDEVLPYYHDREEIPGEKSPVSEHIQRLINMITGSFLPGTSLVPFGGGDWNDSLQPVSKDLAKRMISSWTVEMNYQAFMQYGRIYEMTGEKAKAEELNRICDRIRDDFNRFLVRDGVIAGYGLKEADGSISLLLHPSDRKTGIRYSLLPMNRGIISGIFTPEQALLHQDIIEEFLKGPDGARLMDRPLRYRGGIQEIFQRAESSTFFGREIGLMYVHEHIRYAEALAITGKADAFVRALRQAIPVKYKDIVPSADFRQSNCYYSSSDAALSSRYEADARYDDILTGRMPLKGGWRVYSSGPGIYIGLIVSRLLGIKIECGKIMIDPVIPGSLNGMTANMNILGHACKLTYEIRMENFSPKMIHINEKPAIFTYSENPYRKGGVIIPLEIFLSRLNEGINRIHIIL